MNNPLTRDAVSFPARFVSRYVDRQFLLLAKAKLGVDPAAMTGCLLKAWQEFAAAGSDRHALKSVPETTTELTQVPPADPAVVLLEDFVGWEKESGAWVNVGLEAGFFRLERSDKGMWYLVLDGFFPLNHHLSPRFVHNQAKGGLAKKVRAAERVAKKDAGKHLELLLKDKDSGLNKVASSPQEREEVVALVRNIYGLLKQSPPCVGLNAVIDQCLDDALKVIRSMPEEEQSQVKMWIYQHREKAEFPKEVPEIIRRFPQFLKELQGLEVEG